MSKSSIFKIAMIYKNNENGRPKLEMPTGSAGFNPDLFHFLP